MLSSSRLTVSLLLTFFLFSMLAVSSGCGQRDRRDRERPAVVIDDDPVQVADAGYDDVGGDDVGAGQGDTGGTDPIEPVEPCGGCPSGEVCVNDACEPLPQNCPCPLESYCDLGTNQCVAGCTADDQCLTGRICDSNTRTCKAGCRQDSQCTGSGQICDATTLTCRTGCRQDTQCSGADQICDDSTQVCRSGCRNQGDCGAEQLCSNTVCVSGCTSDSGCTGDRICVDNQCREGCRRQDDCDFPEICSPGLVCVPDTFTEISGGADFTCGILDSYNQVYCWGNDDYGQASPPTRSFEQVSAGSRLACGRTWSGAVECWGSNEYGGTEVPDISGYSFVDISVGAEYVCASTTRNEGERICWGNNLHGRAPTSHSFSNIAFRYMRTSDRVACSIIRIPTREVHCWGDFDRYRSPALDLDLGTHFGVIIGMNGELSSWGHKSDTTALTVPEGLYDQVVAGAAFACALERSTGEVRCFGGSNSYGELNPPAGRFTKITAGRFHGCGLRPNGSVECWGRNDDGQATPPW